MVPLGIESRASFLSSSLPFQRSTDTNGPECVSVHWTQSLLVFGPHKLESHPSDSTPCCDFIHDSFHINRNTEQPAHLHLFCYFCCDFFRQRTPSTSSDDSQPDMDTTRPPEEENKDSILPEVTCTAVEESVRKENCEGLFLP